jgi:hypothetical protein
MTIYTPGSLLGADSHETLTYRDASAALVDLLAPGFFSPARDRLLHGDTIKIVASDGIALVGVIGEGEAMRCYTMART